MNPPRFALILCLLLAMASFCLGENGKTPKYDPKSEVQFKGVVQDLITVEDDSADIHLFVKSDADTLDVGLCPKSFLEEAQMSFDKGDEIQVTGSKTKVKDSDVILAREIVKGEEKLVLRDKNGGPVWIWLKK